MALKTPPIVSMAGYSGSGKTTFMEKLIPALVGLGLRVATIKHDVHGFEMDKPGKDSWRHKQAGATASVISSATKIGMVMDAEYDHDPSELAGFFPDVDMVLTEGYKSGAYPKVEIFRPEAMRIKPLSVKTIPILLPLSPMKSFPWRCRSIHYRMRRGWPSC